MFHSFPPSHEYRFEELIGSLEMEAIPVANKKLINQEKQKGNKQRIKAV